MEPLNSHRVKGASLRSFMTKRLLKQREVLKVDWVCRLEDAMQDPGVTNREKVFIGFVLMLIHAR
eukprot:2359426-Karenia_brevis.AAC.1